MTENGKEDTTVFGHTSKNYALDWIEWSHVWPRFEIVSRELIDFARESSKGVENTNGW